MGIFDKLFSSKKNKENKKNEVKINPFNEELTKLLNLYDNVNKAIVKLNDELFELNRYHAELDDGPINLERTLGKLFITQELLNDSYDRYYKRIHQDDSLELKIEEPILATDENTELNPEPENTAEEIIAVCLKEELPQEETIIKEVTALAVITENKLQDEINQLNVVLKTNQTTTTTPQVEEELEKE